MNTIIQAHALSKHYQRGVTGTGGLLRDTLAAAMRSPLKMMRRRRKEVFGR